jgi:hypothetical protein
MTARLSLLTIKNPMNVNVAVGVDVYVGGASGGDALLVLKRSPRKRASHSHASYRFDQ